jgi:hypothetical protein
MQQEKILRAKHSWMNWMFKDSARNLDAIRWSILTKSATAAMFTSV